MENSSKHLCLTRLELLDPYSSSQSLFYLLVSQQQQQQQLELLLIDSNNNLAWESRALLSDMHPPASFQQHKQHSEYIKSVLQALTLQQGEYGFTLHKGKEDGVVLSITMKPDPQYDISIEWAQFNMKRTEFKHEIVLEKVSKGIMALRVRLFK